MRVHDVSQQYHTIFHQTWYMQTTQLVFVLVDQAMGKLRSPQSPGAEANANLTDEVASPAIHWGFLRGTFGYIVPIVFSIHQGVFSLCFCVCLVFWECEVVELILPFLVFMLEGWVCEDIDVLQLLLLIVAVAATKKPQFVENVKNLQIIPTEGGRLVSLNAEEARVRSCFEAV